MTRCVLLTICCYFFCSIGYALVTPEEMTTIGPANPVRALHVVNRGISVDHAKLLIDKAQASGFNAIILGVLWNNSTWLESAPWLDHVEGMWTASMISAVVAHTKAKGMQIIPNIPLLSHQQLLLGPYFPELMFNSRTYDPRNEEVYKKIYPIIDELIELFGSKTIHIGHDEVVGWTEIHWQKGLLKAGETQLPADLYLEDVLKLYDYIVTKKGGKLWVWGDMLISRVELPGMLETGINGIAQGYGADLRNSLPKDIVICDWHYFDSQLEFPSINLFVKEGFSVLGTTWDREATTRNFSRYAADNGAAGMISSLWFYTQQDEKREAVNSIIKSSGSVFQHYFPSSSVSPPNKPRLEVIDIENSTEY